jgi:hypothetical protein
MDAIKNVMCARLPALFLALLFLSPLVQLRAQETSSEPSVRFREDFSDKELRSFVKANEKVMAIQQESEQKMVNAIEGEGLTVERFHEILQSQRDPGSATAASAEELSSFNNAAQVIIEESRKAEGKMETSIKDAGIDIETYKEIMLAYEQSPDVQSKINKLVSSDN